MGRGVSSPRRDTLEARASDHVPLLARPTPAGTRCGLERKPRRASAADRTLFSAVDELVRDHRITPGTWQQLAGRYDDQQLIELVLCVGAYTMVAGFLNSLEVEPDVGLASLP